MCDDVNTASYKLFVSFRMCATPPFTLIRSFFSRGGLAFGIMTIMFDVMMITVTFLLPLVYPYNDFNSGYNCSNVTMPGFIQESTVFMMVYWRTLQLLISQPFSAKKSSIEDDY